MPIHAIDRTLASGLTARDRPAGGHGASRPLDGNALLRDAAGSVRM